ncbi:MAG: hypothetical protein AMXMBFR33_42400 [Candidatus Xenobia bacterium]
MSELPLGQSESSKLEFKSGEVLKDPSKVGREVVAFLNAAGGVLWVGLEEEQSRAVRVSPLPDPEQARRRLLDYLVDTVEPTLNDTELRSRVVEGAIRLELRPGKERGPYCLLGRDGRLFVKRVDARTRPMTREEIRDGFRGPGAAEESWTSRLSKERKKCQGEMLWLGFLPRPELELDLDEVEGLLRDPARTGNRRDGWSFANEYGEVRRRKERLEKVGEEDWRLEVHRSGLIALRLPLVHLYRQGPERTFWPPALLEHPTSVFRLARTVYGPHEPEEVAVDLALLGVAGWTLRPYTVSSIRFQVGDVAPFYEEQDLIWSRPLLYSWSELEQNPDRCAYRWIRLVYAAFGYTESQIPVEFHPERGLSFTRR